MSDRVLEFWAKFCAAFQQIDACEPYQAWYFGNTPEMASELAALVINGTKIATASLAAVNKIKPDEAPIDAGYSIVTDYYGEPQCVIQTTEIRHLPFDEVDAKFAFDEGEGDRSLEYWQAVHRAYFERESDILGVEFNDRSVVCCERFKLLFPK